MTTTAAHTITKEEWIRAWFDHWYDGQGCIHWRDGWEGYILVDPLPEVDPDWGPWMIEWDPKPGTLIVDGLRVSSPEWL